MLFDSHAHLNFKVFDKDYQKIIQKCLDEKIWLINVGCGYSYSQKAVEIAENYNKGIYASIGLHPNDDTKEFFDYQKYLALGKKSGKIVAIGETGLDYYRIKNDELRIKQKEIFKKQIELAIELNKPLIIHCRDAHEDVLEILNSCFLIHNSKLRGVIHCFTGNQQQAEQYLKLNFFIGFTGIITYSSQYDEIIKNLPLEKILIETDCPYLAPVPYRGQKNQPPYVKYVAQKIADIRGLAPDEIGQKTFNNALNLFQIKSAL